MTVRRPRSTSAADIQPGKGQKEETYDHRRSGVSGCGQIVPPCTTLVIIPTFNERENLPLILQRVHQACPPRAMCWFVDDNSPRRHGPAGRRAGVGRPRPRIHVMHRTVKDRFGRCIPGWIRPGGSAGSTPRSLRWTPTAAPRLNSCTYCSTRSMPVADLAIGSRYVDGGNVQNWRGGRWALSWTANTYARLALGIGIHDITAGYRAYRSGSSAKIDLDHVESKGYCFQIDLTWRTITNGFVVVEVPITFTGT